MIWHNMPVNDSCVLHTFCESRECFGVRTCWGAIQGDSMALFGMNYLESGVDSSELSYRTLRFLSVFLKIRH